MIAEQARLRPEAIAVVYQDEQLTYRGLERRANQLANHLRALGVGPECVVGLYLERLTEMMIGWLGILKAGGAYLPLEVGQPEERLGRMLKDAGVDIVVTRREVAGSLPGEGLELVMLDVDREGLAGDGRKGPGVKLSAMNLAYVIYTSGSTGRPKGVMVAHGAVLNLLEGLKGAIYEGEGEELTVSLNAPLGFDASVKQVIQLGRGARLCIVPEEERRDGEAMLEYLRSRQVDVLDGTPLQMRALMDAGLGREGRDPKKVLVGGEAIESRGWEEMGKSGEVKYYNVYGPTECTVDATACEVRAGSEATIGRPIANARIYILDEKGRVAPTGVKGEIYIGGAGVGRGYVGEGGQTAEKFVPDGLWKEEGGRMYRTGDQGRYLEDGRIVYEGRRDGQVKVRGYRIELGEIEEVLRSYPGVREAVVTVREDEPGQKRLVGYVVGREEGEIEGAPRHRLSNEPRALERNGNEAEYLGRYVRERLPNYMAPAALVVVEKLPRTRNGKVDRGALPKPEELKKQEKTEEGAPRSAYEEIISGIWKEVLEVEHVRRGDNFFEIGGHSLLATQVISRVRSAFGVEVGVRSIFEKPTVEGLASKMEEAIGAGEKDEAPPLAKASREGRLPLSFAQQRLWFIDQLEPGHTIYNIHGAVRVEGRLNLEAMERVINEVIRRHEVLRTTMEVSAEGEPMQVIDEWKPRRLEVEDLSSLSPEERQREARRRAREEAGTGFDLRRGPLLRMKVLRLEEEEHVLLYTMHHIVSDWWSMGILVREVGELYRAYDAGEPSPLEELPIQYADFAVWQREWLSGAVLEKELDYWRGQLAGVEALELPADHPRPAIQSHRGARHHFVIEEAVTEKLRALSQREGVTLFMTLLGGFDVVMSRYSGQEDIVLGTDSANRNRAEIEGLIGFFINQLVMRVNVKGGESFRELLKSVREVCLGAYAHQDMPFEKLVEELQLERDLSRSPLFQAKLILQNAARERPELGSAKLSGLGDGAEMANGMTAAKIDLTVAIAEAGRDLVVVTEYDRELFEPATIERLIGHYGNILKGILEEEGRAVSELSLLSDEEREQIVEVWNQTARQYPGEECLHELFAEQARQAPERIAAVSEWEQLSYGELNRRANQLGRYLQRLGVGPEVVVGLCLERSVEMVVGALGALKAGGAYLPLDAESPLERLGYMLEDAGVGVVLTQRALEARLPVFWGQTVLLDEEWERIGEESDSEPESVVDAENLAYVIYTSGSTGRPKGVMVRHGGLANYLRWASEAYRIGEGAGAPVQSSIGFDLTVTSLYGPLVSGRSVRLLSEAEGIEGLSRALSRDGGYSLVKITPAHLGVLAEQLESVEVEGRAGVLVIGGEELKSGGLKYWQERARGTRLINEYGPTETVVGCCVYEVGAGENGREAVPIGRPIANARMYILDEYLEPAPIGVNGEIYISGAGLARGYLGKAELTAERFIPNGFGGKDGERMYRTGDVGRRLPDGNLEFIGRADRQVKVRGYRIELGEIEAVLNEHRSVRQSVVTASEDGRGGKRLVGYVAGAEGVTIAELKRHVRERLPEYMAPEAIMVLEEIPVTMNGKIDRKRLPSMNGADRQLDLEYLGARTAIEEILVGIFEEVLGLDRVGIRDNFFEIGGHSLLATQVISRVRSAFGVEVGVRSIFEKPTVEGLASKMEEAIGAGEKDEAPPLVKASREGRLPLSFAQQRLWFIDQLEPGNTIYNCPGAVRLEGRLNLEALERVINEVIRRHEVLRTTMEVSAEGEPMQVIDEWKPRRLEVEDLTSLSPEEKEREARRRAREEAGTGFDLRRGPLLRVKVLRLEEEEHVLLYTMHHIVSDWWSMGILDREVRELYWAYDAGEPSPLEELPIQYADFAVWQREWLSGAVLEKELDYWRERLAEAETLELPTDHPRPAGPSHRGARHYFVIEEAVTEKLRALSQREGVTLFMTLLGGFDLVMSRYSGQEDIVLGTDSANRNRAEIEGLIGFFVNQLVMRVNVKRGESFRELLKSVREVCLGAYAHQDVPFEKLVEELQLKRDLSRSPLFQAKLILRNAARERPELGSAKLSGLSEWAGMANVMTAAKIDLTVAIAEAGRDLVVATEYDRELFEPATIERLIGHYGNILKGIVEEKGEAVSELSLLSDEEREQIVEEWNQTARQYPGEECLHELFAEQARQAPERIAVVSEVDQVSYRELNRRANQLGRYLQRLGVGPEVVVGLCLERSVEMVVGALGALKAGGAYLPLDAESPLERLGYMLEDAGVGVALTQRALEARLPVFWGQTVLLDEEWERIGEESDSEPESVVDAENLAYVIYTSGSTGRPKGVMVRHGGLANYLRWASEAYRIGDGAGAPVQSSIGFDLTVTSLYGPLVSGRSVRLLPEAEGIEGLSRALSRDGGYSLVKITPAHLGVLAEQLESVEVEGRAGVLVIGGEELKSGGLKYWQERARGTRLINEYGPTETVVGCCVYEVGAGENGREAVPIGRPIANARMYILDEYLEPAPIGANGEIYISGAGLARGYLGKPELTAERFIPNRFGGKSGERMYRTGDVGRRLPDGNLEFIGRADRQVKVRGYRIELGEIEAVLNEHRSVRQSVVTASEDGRGGKRLVGYVAGAEGVTIAELKRHVRERLPEYMAPEAIMVLEEIPVTMNGKIDRKKLPALSGILQPMKEGLVAPRDVLELQLAQIWESVLGVEPIGVKDDFFDLGGHSLLAVSLMARIRKVIGRDLPLSALFQGGTIEYLAAMLRREADSLSWSCLVGIQATGSQPPLFFAHPAGGTVLCYLDLARCLGPDQPFYGLQTPGLYREQALYTSVEDLAAHYIEALRVIQPEGPYFLGGYSLGGVIAYEMAQQLVARGQTVGQLLIVDTEIQYPRKERPEAEHVENGDAELLMNMLTGVMQISEEDLHQFQGDERLDYVLKAAIGLNLIPPDIDVEQARFFLNIYRTNVRAVHAYTPQIYPGTVTLFKRTGQAAISSSSEAVGSEPITEMSQDPTKVWESLAAGGVRVIGITGRHATMLNSPQVETLARLIKDCLILSIDGENTAVIK